jgi:hypothetical protein
MKYIKDNFKPDLIALVDDEFFINKIGLQKSARK